MNFKQLEAFRMTVKLGTISDAAKYLHMPQPSISRMIADLEYALELSLFNRMRNRLFLTEEGRLFYEKVEDHFESLGALSLYAQSIKSSMKKSLRITIAPAMSHRLLTDALAIVQKKYPEYSITVNTHSSEQTIKYIQQKKFDLGFCLTPLATSNMQMEAVGHLKACCILPKNHRLAEQPSITINDLAGEDLILPTNQYVSRASIEKRVQKINCRVVAYAMLSNVAHHMVKSGMGVAITEPVASIETITGHDDGVVVRPLNEPISYSYWALYNDNLVNMKIVQILVDLVKESFEKYFDPYAL